MPRREGAFSKRENVPLPVTRLRARRSELLHSAQISLRMGSSSIVDAGLLWGLGMAYRGMTAVYFCFWCLWLCLLYYAILYLMDIIFGAYGFGGGTPDYRANGLTPAPRP